MERRGEDGKAGKEMKGNEVKTMGKKEKKIL